MSAAGTDNALLKDTSSPTLNHDAPKVTDLRKTESIDIIPDINATTLTQDMRELSAWFRARDGRDGREISQSFAPSSISSPDERGVPHTPANHRASVALHRASLSPASSLTSLDSDGETGSESSLTSLDSDPDDDPPISRTPVGRGASDGISPTTLTPVSKATVRKRKRPKLGGQQVRHSMHLRAKRRRVASG